MKHGLTKRQNECLEFIGKYVDEHGYSPSYDEIGGAMGYASKNSVYQTLSELEKRGHVTRLKYCRRSVRLI